MLDVELKTFNKCWNEWIDSLTDIRKVELSIVHDYTEFIDNIRDHVLKHNTGEYCIAVGYEPAECIPNETMFISDPNRVFNYVPTILT